MTDHQPQIEFYLRDLRSRAWSEFTYPRSDLPDPTQAFARAVKVYEDELERKLTADRKTLLDSFDIAQERSQAPGVREGEQPVVVIVDEAPGLFQDAPSADERKRMLERLIALGHDVRKAGVFVEQDAQREQKMIPITCPECSGPTFSYGGIVQRHRVPGTGVRCDAAGERDRREQQAARMTFEGMGGTEALLRGPQREEDGPAAAEERPVRGGR